MTTLTDYQRRVYADKFNAVMAESTTRLDRIPVEELGTLLKALGIDLTSIEVDAMVDEVRIHPHTTSGRSFINFPDFLTLMNIHHFEVPYFVRVCRHLDVKGRGTLSRGQLGHALIDYKGYSRARVAEWLNAAAAALKWQTDAETAHLYVDLTEPVAAISSLAAQEHNASQLHKSAVPSTRAKRSRDTEDVPQDSASSDNTNDSNVVADADSDSLLRALPKYYPGFSGYNRLNWSSSDHKDSTTTTTMPSIPESLVPKDLVRHMAGFMPEPYQIDYMEFYSFLMRYCSDPILQRLPQDATLQRFFFA